MAKEVKKVKTKAKINWGWDAPEDRKGKASRSTKSTARKVKKIEIKALLIFLLVILFGGVIGAGVCWYVCRDDCFTIIGNEEITLTLKEDDELIGPRNSYRDDGVNVISFGRDVSDKVYIETNLKQYPDGNYYADEIGTYYIIYKVDDIKYGKIFTVQRIRLITFVEPTPDNIVD